LATIASMRTLLPLIALVLAGCLPKAPVPPPQYEDPSRAPSGVAGLEAGIGYAIELQTVTDEEYAELTRAAGQRRVKEDTLQRYILVAVDRGDINEAARVLLSRAYLSPRDEGPTSDAFGLVLGHLQWETCADLAREFLLKAAVPGVFLVRALCQERAGNPEGATENLLAAHKLMPIELDALERFADTIRERGAAGQIDPGPRDLYDQMMVDVSKRGMLDRLFVQHLMGIFDTAVPVGTLRVGGISDSDVQAVILSRAKSYRYCQESLAHANRKLDKPLAGEGRAQFTIGPLGQVQEIKWTTESWSEHPAGAQLTQCLTTELQRLQFPAPRFGRPRLAAYTFRYGS